MNGSTIWFVLSFGSLALGCSGTGACVGSGGVVDECKDEWTEDECAEWDDEGVNGSSWEFHGGDTCEDLGYSVECSDGSFVKSSDDC